MNDLTFAFRQLAKNRSFTVVALLTLALGIGASTAMFTILNSLFFRPVPVKDPESVVRLHTSDRDNSSFGHMSYPDFLDIRDQSLTLAGLAASSPGREVFFEADSPQSGGADVAPERIRGAFVSSNYFAVLGSPFAVGQAFPTGEALNSGANPLIVLSNEFWRRRFNANPAIVGQSIKINGIALTVAAVLGDDFHTVRFDRMPDVWIPLEMQPQVQEGESWLTGRDRFWLQVDGRLKAGMSLETARAEMNVLANRLAEIHRGGKIIPLALMPGSFLEPEDREKLLPVSVIAMSAVGLVTLIAGANLGNLLLFRAVSRRKEIALRLSLGASRRRLLRQLLTESMLLGGLGAVIGIICAFFLADLIVLLAAGPDIRSAVPLSLDWRVVSYAIGLAGLAVFGFGLVPALQATRQDLSSVLRGEEGGIGHGMGRSRLRGMLVSGQVALSLILLVSSGLMLRTLQRGLTLDTGIEVERTIAVSPDLARHRYNESQAAEFNRRLAERLASLPHVRGIALASAIPLSGIRNASDFHIVSFVAGENIGREVLAENEVSANFFDVIGATISRGRMFTDREVQTRQPVAVVTDAMAQRAWPGENPLGKLVRRGKSGPTLEIVGTVRNTTNRALYEDEADIYLPVLPDRQRKLALLVSTGDGAKSLPGIIVREVRALDASLWPEVAYLADSTRSRLGAETTMSWLASALGLVALALAMSGLYGVLSWLGAQRTREMGIRMALGARRANVIQLVLRQGMWLVGAGMMMGMLGSMALSRLLKGIIYDLSPLDPIALAGGVFLLSLAALLACWLPARRAASLNPMEALRHE